MSLLLEVGVEHADHSGEGFDFHWIVVLILLFLLAFLRSLLFLGLVANGGDIIGRLGALIEKLLNRIDHFVDFLGRKMRRT